MYFVSTFDVVLKNVKLTIVKNSAMNKIVDGRPKHVKRQIK